MENHSPAHLKTRKIAFQEYVRCLQAVAGAGVRRISFTGGEPTTNGRLPDIIRAASECFEVVELTSNGYALAKMIPSIAPHLKLVKVSLDSPDRDKFASVTRGGRNALDFAVGGIEAALAAGVPVAINFVLMKSNCNDLESVVDLARRLKAESAGSLHVSVLDFYYSEVRRDLWEREYMPVTEVEHRLAAKYGNLREEVRFGCRFAWVDCNGVEVRFKDSAGATMRGEICKGCLQYCQEGLYGLKISTAGWVTTCPSSVAYLGADLAAAIELAGENALLSNMLARVRNATPDPQSFAKLLVKHGLSPVYEASR